MHSRRSFLAALAAFVPQRQYRVALIGNSANGAFGHEWDVAWQGIPNVEVVAVADPVESGRAKAQTRANAPRAYGDYREMIAKEKPDIVGICPRGLSERVPMLAAAAEAKAHVLIEKPLAATMAEADEMLALAARNGITMQVGHPARIFAVTSETGRLLQKGTFGTLQEIRARGKEDRRAGGEDMIVLGSHCFDLMRYFAGDPLWCFAHVLDGPTGLHPAMMHPATEEVGKVGGDNLAAMFLFPNGVHGYFASKVSEDREGRRCGVTLYGSKGFVYLPLSNVPSAPPVMLRSPAWVPEKDEPWQRIEYPADKRVTSRAESNQLMARDLLHAIENKREPVCSARDGHWAIRMVDAVYRSQFSGGRVSV